MSSAPSIAVIGAGIIGLACAWELQKRGSHVTVFDKGRLGLGASAAAAGMLGPAFEAVETPGEHSGLFELTMQSGALWPDYVEALEAVAQMAVDYDPRPTLAVAVNDAQAAQLESVEIELRDLPSGRLAAVACVA